MDIGSRNHGSAEWTVSQVMAWMNEFAPPHLAMEGDVIGLQIGNPARPVYRVMVALDAYPEVIHQAVTSGTDMLITHHAMLFRPLKRIDTSTARGRAIAVALAHDLAVFAAHTNLDATEGGVNDVLAERIGLTDVDILDTLSREPLYKLVVYVPQTHHESVLFAISEAGAGQIGAYSHCAFSISGVGTFLPGSGTNPYIGQQGQLERVEEVRLETIVPQGRLSSVLEAMYRVHPYEEVAYDVYPMALEGRAFGIGRIGRLLEPVPLDAFARTVKQRLGLRHIRFGGTPTQMVQRVAVLGGAGGRWAEKARKLGADVLVTSDVDHHTVAEAAQDGLAIVDATHAALERPAMEALADRLQRAFGASVDVQVAAIREDPFTWC